MIDFPFDIRDQVMITADIEILRVALGDTRLTSHRQALLKQIYRLDREANTESETTRPVRAGHHHRGRQAN